VLGISNKKRDFFLQNWGIKRIKMDGLHLFIDNSNIFIEAQRVARIKFYYDDELVVRLRISYGALLDEIRQGRSLKETVLVGSRPPDNDALWDKLRNLDVEPRIFDRSVYTGKEKRVDAEVINAIRDTMEDNSEPGTVAIVAGDQDYVTTLERCVKKKWEVEIYFWEQASGFLKNLCGTKFINLDNYFEKITFKEKSRE
jgi:hypothetical protein